MNREALIEGLLRRQSMDHIAKTHHGRKTQGTREGFLDFMDFIREARAWARRQES